MESVIPLHGHNLLKLLLFLTILHHVPHSTTSLDLLPKEALPTKSGYLEVNSTTGSALFYTYYEAQKPTTPLSQTPLLIWLQGGPGCSSMLGNFYELGPWLVTSNVSVKHNPGAWNRIFGVLFIDNPIGTGFSIAASLQEIPRNQHDVAKHLFIAIKKFIKLDDMFKTRPIYVTGESYAGKYVPALGYYILKKNAILPVSSRVNLAGVAIGKGLTDPATQTATYAVNAYYSGFINDKQKKILENLQKKAVELTQIGNWTQASNARDTVVQTLLDMTGFVSVYDFRRLVPYQDYLVAEFLTNMEVKKALGAKENIVFEACSDVVEDALTEDIMKSVRYMVDYLVRETKVLLYQGQCDMLLNVVSNEAWIKKLKWARQREFMEADRKVWRVNETSAGSVQKFEKLSHVVVLNAGHLVPADQPLNSQAMIEDWVLDRGLFAD
ncbi:serine carboxypeptidase-like 50 [Coffea arabica]|uniref:Carboxypeptidase n=1 Tax=Coffea arabica TaxID=13443 RepID=A0A6P6V0I6_COFAR|nr:serine carboxypeptidase-like 50 [Coffea arabica]